jgi:hypothetical protein
VANFRLSTPFSTDRFKEIYLSAYIRKFVIKHNLIILPTLKEKNSVGSFSIARQAYNLYGFATIRVILWPCSYRIA